MRRSIFAAFLAALSFVPLGCDSSNDLSYGDVNSIIVAASPEVWNQVEDTLKKALQPTITTTVREEEVFQVTYHDPADSLWGNFRRFRQILLIGRRDDPWMLDPLEDSETPEGSKFPYATDIWARGQTLTLVVLPDQDPAGALVRQLPDLRAAYLEWYRQWALSRMFVSGRDSALVDTLRRSAGFELLFPEVYTWERRNDSVYVFRNDNPDPSELIRQFTVTWMSPPPDTLTVADLVAWRDGLSRQYYEPAQLADTTLMSEATLTIQGWEGRRLQAVWTNPPEADWPAAGNFIVQTVSCPEQDRLYLIDAWLYAPGKDKFEYLYQIETILDSFRCGGN